LNNSGLGEKPFSEFICLVLYTGLYKHALVRMELDTKSMQPLSNLMQDMLFLWLREGNDVTGEVEAL